MARVVLAMSGGVDSSVAAWLLRESGHEIVGLFMRHGQALQPACTLPGGEAARHKQGCCSEADAADARRVAERLGVPCYVLNFEREFGRIVEYFVETYTAGRTPNPCIVCNTWLKFGKLFEYADSVGAEFVATGHYARLVSVPPGEPGALCTDEIALCQGLDASKDQSYVLFGIERHLLPRLMFPIGDHHKAEIRRIAGRLGLKVAEKRDSQEICFVPDQDHARFVREHRDPRQTSGKIVATDGTVVGRHDGYERFTIGQRKGLGIAFGEPRYVVRIEPTTRRVVVGTHDELARTELTAAEANWLIDEPAGPLPCRVKIRYRSRPAEATVEPLPGGRFRVRFAEPCYGVAPGQAAVCYRGQRVVGGGWIQ
ncbi:MAG: tRNA 2-thiouridine(34) synthase MnmA [Pirellulales bacterium]|nr:tRNA 2-thiouridine(34) synthase MnmA [Pirellulales bacterium]